LTKNC